MKYSVKYCNVCHTPTTHIEESTVHYLVSTCEVCHSRTTQKDLNWKISNMLEPDKWEADK